MHILTSAVLLTGILASQIPSRPQSSITAIWANDGADKVTRDELRASNLKARAGEGRDGRGSGAAVVSRGEAVPHDFHGVFNSIWDGARVRLFGARNEVVAFALIIEAASDTARDVSVSFDTLTGPQGAVIGSGPAGGDGVFDWTERNIELFHIRYLEIQGLSRLCYESYDERHIPKRFRRPWTGEGQGYGVWEDRPDHNKLYPEIAIPLALVGDFDIPAGRNQSIWADIYIPKTAPAGRYRGTIRIREGSASIREIPVSLLVRDFSLPDDPNAKTMVYHSYADINTRYLGEAYPSPDTPEAALSKLVRDRHFLLAHRHRISLIDANIAPGDWTEDSPNPEWIARLDGSLFVAGNGYDGPGVGVGNSVFSIGTYGSWTWKDGDEQDMRQHTDAWSTWFLTHSPGTEHFLYLIDESSDYEQIEEWSRWINENPGPGQNMYSLATIPAVVAIEETPSLDIPSSTLGVGITDQWQAAVDFYLGAPDKRFYLYNGKRPASGSFATEDDGVALRELAWGHYKKGIDRWFVWESTYYNNYQGGMGETNVFEVAQTFGSHSHKDEVLGETGWNYTNGDGVLFYPGTDLVYPENSYGVNGPFASLRLKQWRRGIQDVDYLSMAALVDPGRVGEIVDWVVPKVLWEYGVADTLDPTWVLTDISWSTDPDVWEQARGLLADIIEEGARREPDRDDRPRN